jgi:hypothetical protein
MASSSSPTSHVVSDSSDKDSTEPASKIIFPFQASPTQSKENDQPNDSSSSDNTDSSHKTSADSNQNTLGTLAETLLNSSNQGQKAFKKRKMNNNNNGPRMVRNRAPPPLSTLSALRGPPLSSAEARQIMWDQYQPWVLATYGDAAKTKTITTKKYARIVALLKSLSSSSLTPLTAPALDRDGQLLPESSTPPAGGSTSEAAKFKLWVKSKGFHLGPPPGHMDRGLPHALDMLYIPTGTDKVSPKLPNPI